MTYYNNFIGIDIGKYNFVVTLHGDKKVAEYKNGATGIASFLEDYQSVLLPNSLCILEVTGGYELELLFTLLRKSIPVHRANTRKVKNFIRSFGNTAKTDSLDAKALALYGFERSSQLTLFVPQSSQALKLYALVQRRNDLKQILVAEKNRFKSPSIASTIKFIKDSHDIMVETISNQIESITLTINTIIAKDFSLAAKKEKLKSIPGIGNIIANELLILLPELGELNRKQIASLAGLAPKANDSGRFKGYRPTGYGRTLVKPLLFMAAMAARNSNSHLKTFYQNLISKGKRKMVALTALMRKIIVIANAKLRDFNIETVFV
jgi:transposase